MTVVYHDFRHLCKGVNGVFFASYEKFQSLLVIPVQKSAFLLFQPDAFESDP